MIRSIYRFFNLLSIDVAVGAVACAAMFARFFEVQVRTEGYASLGLTVWCIYTADHLLDARRIRGWASTRRHLAHQRFFALFVFLLVLAVTADVWLIGRIRTQVLEPGLILASIILIYLLFQQKLKSFKEAVVSILYCSGVLLPALSLNTLPISTEQIVMVALFAFTTFINLILFSWFECENDTTQKQVSFAVSFGKEKTRILLFLLFFFQFALLTSLTLMKGFTIPVLVLGIMNLFLVSLFWNPEWFGQKDRYRIFGDSIFLFPLVFFLV